MSFIFSNPNPAHNLIGDCAIRAVSIALDQTWDKTYSDICSLGFYMCDMPSSDRVWGDYLRLHGFVKEQLPTDVFPRYTVKDFCLDNPKGIFCLGTGSHVVSIIDGNYYDIWDSGDEVPIYFWRKE